MPPQNLQANSSAHPPEETVVAEENTRPDENARPEEPAPASTTVPKEPVISAALLLQVLHD